MNTSAEQYQKKRMTAAQALELIQDRDYLFSAQAAAEPQEILSNLQHLKETGVKGVTLNTCLPIRYYEAKGLLHLVPLEKRRRFGRGVSGPAVKGQ